MVNEYSEVNESNSMSQDMDVLSRHFEDLSLDVKNLLDSTELSEIKEQTTLGDLGKHTELVGDVKGDMDTWHVQAYTRSCAVACQEFVAEQLLDKEYDETKMLKVAIDHGWYDNGTAPENVGKLLEYEGLHVERSYHGTVEDIEKVLSEGGKVIVGVDSDEILSKTSDDFKFLPGTDADHAVQVIGIDKTNPNDVKVILNDPGNENGKGSVLSLKEFNEAWEDSSNFIVKVSK